VFDGYSDAGFYSKLQEQVEPFNSNAFACAGMAYCLSKRFVIYYSQKNTVRFAKKCCRILSISPGSYMTPMHQALLDNQPETAQMQLDSIPFERWVVPTKLQLSSPASAHPARATSPELIS
jgi:NAD(P)-dependent dehydrogenase (short-subunit alcohol dehydrogenase family)